MNLPLPESLRSPRARRLTRPGWLAGLGRVEPISEAWGRDRGRPIDRYYIERFVEGCRADIRGRVLEVLDARYTQAYGTDVERSDVLDIDADNANATIVADLAAADNILSDTYDCFILTQTLTYVYDLESAVQHAHRVLRPGGVLLATVPSVSRVYPRYPDYWRFTPAACLRLFSGPFQSQDVEVRAHGNVRVCAAFLTGLACEDLIARQLDHEIGRAHV